MELIWDAGDEFPESGLEFSIGYNANDYSNLSAYYKLDGDATDATSNNNDATNNGGTYVDNGFFNSEGWSPSSASDYLEVPEFAGTQITLSCWYEYDGTQNGTWNTIFGDGNGSHHHIIIQDGTDEIGFYNGNFYSSGFALTPGQRYMLTVVLDGTTHKLYIDGNLQNSSTNGFDNSASTNSLTIIGNYEVGGNQAPWGVLDEIMVFNNYAMTDTEVSNLYSDPQSSSKTLSSKIGDNKPTYVQTQGTLNSSISATIYQDETGGSTPTNQYSTTISSEGYLDVNNMTATPGSTFWIDLDYTSSVPSTINSISLQTSASSIGYLDKLRYSKGSNFPSIKVTSSDTTTDLNVSYTIVPWTDAEYIDSSTFTFDATNNQITVEEDGIYEMRAVIYTLSDGSDIRSNPVARFKLNGSTNLVGWGGSGYVRYAEGHRNSSNSPHNIEQLNAGDSIQIETFREGGNSGRTMEADKSVFMMKKLPGEVTISSKPVEGRETGLINAGNQGIVTVCNLQDGETLSIQSAGFTLSDGQAVPLSLNLEIITMDNAGGYTVQKTIISGDGSTVHDQLSGDPYTSWTNNTGSSSTVAVIVNNNTASNQDVISYIEGQIE